MSANRVWKVGIAGAAGAGKSTIAAALIDLIKLKRAASYSPVLCPFAAPLKEGFARMGVTKTDTPFQYREYLQLVGAGMRAFNQDWWVNKFHQTCDIYATSPPTPLDCVIVVADDCRYENECDACDFVVFVEPGFVSNRKLSGSQLAHESEDMARAGFNPKLHDLVVINPLNDPKTPALVIFENMELALRNVCGQVGSDRAP